MLVLKMEVLEIVVLFCEQRFSSKQMLRYIFQESGRELFVPAPQV